MIIMTSTKLEPCPFCGNTEKIELEQSEYGNTARWMQCRKCQSCGPTHPNSITGAINAWNERPIEKELFIKSEERKQALLEALHIILEHGTPTMKAHTTLIQSIRSAIMEEK